MVNNGSDINLFILCTFRKIIHNLFCKSVVLWEFKHSFERLLSTKAVQSCT